MPRYFTRPSGWYCEYPRHLPVVSQFEKLPTDRNGYLDFAGWTLEDVVRVAPRYGPEGRSNLIFDEASGALIVRPDSDRVVVQALGREVRSLKFQLQLSRLRLKCRYFRLYATCSLLKGGSYLFGFLR